jgi:hypothetical protein
MFVCGQWTGLYQALAVNVYTLPTLKNVDVLNADQRVQGRR